MMRQRIACCVEVARLGRRRGIPFGVANRTVVTTTIQRYVRRRFVRSLVVDFMSRRVGVAGFWETSKGHWEFVSNDDV
jgi:hypothetical protein